MGEDSALLPSLLTLSDVFCVGHHACRTARVGPPTTVTVIGDGAVGLSAILAPRRLRAERILLMGRQTQRTDLGRELGATDVVPERGADGIERVRELTGGDGTHAMLECVGSKPALEMALGVVRDGGAQVRWRSSRCRASSSTALGRVVSKSISFAHVGRTTIRTMPS